MRRSTAISLGAATATVLDVAVTVEALRSGHPALACVAAVAGLVTVVIAVHARRPAIELRPDLATWTSRTAAATGESEVAIVHRALTRHRAALDGERGPGD